MAKTLREKCVNKEVERMIGNIEDLYEMWSIMDTCCERPENSKFEAIQPIVELKKCKMSKSTTIREFYSVLRAAFKLAKVVGHLELLGSKQTLPDNIRKIPLQTGNNGQ